MREVVMNMFPLFYGNLPVSVGVEIRYEEFDAEHLMHMLYFLEGHEKRCRGTFVLIPAVALNGDKSTVSYIKKCLDEYPEGERNVNGYVSVYFLDEMRPLFEEYLNTLEAIRIDADKAFEWGNEHQFFPLLFYFKEIEKIFFPKKISMH
jgi:hypothetical protein